MNKKRMPVVIGGGAMRGPSAVGALERLEQEGLTPSSYTGVSIGSTIAAMRANGVSYGDVRSWFLSGPTEFGVMLRALVPSFNPLRYLGGGLVDLLPIMRRLVDRFDLKPRASLRIVAFDVIRFEPVVFEGEDDYDLAVALAASCTVPMLFRPVPYRWRGRYYLLVDGGIYHPHPGTFCPEPAVVIKLIDTPSWLYGDRPQDILIDAGKPWSPYFTCLTASLYEELHQFGASQAESSAVCH